MSRFVTQAVSEQPVVVLVGAASHLRSLLSVFFKRHEFAVLTIEYQETQRLAEVLSSQPYKVLLLEGWRLAQDAPVHEQVGAELTEEDLSSRLELIEQIKTKRSSLRGVYFIQRFQPFALTHPEYLEKKLRYQIEKEYPTVTQVQIQDVADARMPLWFWKHLTATLDSSTLSPFEQSVHLQSSKAMLLQLQRILLSSQDSGRYVIKGAEQKMTDVAFEVARQYQQYFQTDITVDDPEKISTASEELAQYEHIQGRVEPLPTLVQDLVQQLPSQSREKEEKHQENNHASQAVLPQMMPPTERTGTVPAPSKNIAPVPPTEPAELVKSTQQTKTESKKEGTNSGAASVVSSTSNYSKPTNAQSLMEKRQAARQNRSVLLQSAMAEAEQSTETASQQKRQPNSSSIQQQVTTTKNTPSDKQKSAQDTVLSSVDSKLFQLFSQERSQHKTEHITSKTTKTKKITLTNKKRSALFYGGIGLVGVCFGLLTMAAVFFINQSVVQRLLFEQLESPTESPRPLLMQSSSLLRLQTETYELVLPPLFFDSAYQVLALAEEWQAAQAELEDFNQHTTDILLTLVGANPEPAQPQQINQTTYETLSRLSSRIESLLEDDEQQQLPPALEDYVTFLEDQRRGFITYQQLAPLLPDLLARDGKRTYAVVFQNEQELRATGGFIQAIALVTIEDGMIIDTQVVSSYQLDERLAAVVTPPNDLRQVLDEERLFLRDSNWNPDFSTSAEQIMWFLERQLNEDVDGVIGINISVLEDVLRATGPLDLPQFNELVTDRNINERMEFHSEVTLVDSDQSSDYASAVLTALLRKTATLSEEKAQEFLAASALALREKRMALYLPESEEQATFTSFGWTGEVLVPSCPAQFSDTNCIVDSFAAIDSNIGINKANFHTTRRDEHVVNVEPTQAIHRHTVRFENQSTSNAWPKGAYQSYLRFLLPSSARLRTIVIDGKSLSADQVITSTIGKQAAVGVLSETPIQDSTEVVITYTVPHALETGDAYTFFLQKQLGIMQPLSSLNVVLDESLSPTLIAPQADVSEQIISFSNIDQKHTFVGIQVQ